MTKILVKTLIFLFLSLGSSLKTLAQNSGKGISKNVDENEVAKEFLLKLRNENADTIIVYQRTCINCCDFFNIFWSANGVHKYQKIFYDIKTHHVKSLTINMSNDSIFSELKEYYKDLKDHPVKFSMHKLDSTIITTLHYYHYCFSEIEIYTPTDSILGRRMNDQDFEKYIYKGYGGQTITYSNDNYLSNLNSPWNKLLNTIEREVKKAPEMTQRELDSTRINRKYR